MKRASQQLLKEIPWAECAAGRLIMPAATTAIILLLTAIAHGQNSLYQFDANGSLLAQTAATSGPPVIVSQPHMQVVRPGELASFFVAAADPRGLNYQWRFNGTNLPAPSADVLAFSNVNATNQGAYDVVLSNSFGSTSVQISIRKRLKRISVSDENVGGK